MIYTTVENTVLYVQQELFDDLTDEPILPKPGYPQLKLIDASKATISTVTAAPMALAGTWCANVPIPNFNLDTKREFTLKWRVVDRDGVRTSISDAIIVEPKADKRETDVVAVFGDYNFSFALPTKVTDLTSAKYQIYFNNVPVYPDYIPFSDAGVQVDNSAVDSTRVVVPLNASTGSLYASLLRVMVTVPGFSVPQSYLYRLWAVTPQILLTMSHLEDFLNKSRVENVIPELRYTTGDLMGYLERGLYMFNMLNVPTYFTGLNMQGPLFEAHLICSEYQALSAQLIAEGSLAFDFSGQGISLNVDRTAQLDSAIGRVQEMIDSRLVPLKKQMMANGIVGGDGSAGSKSMLNAYSKGRLGISNMPTTNIPLQTNLFIGRRGSPWGGGTL